MKKSKIMVVVSVICLLLAQSSVVMANTTEAHNVKLVQLEDRAGNKVKYLASVEDEGYLKITQIIQNSQNIKIETSTFEDRLLISGKVNRGTVLTIKVFNEKEDVQTHHLTVGATRTFSQPLEIQEGDNTIVISYSNSNDEVKDHISFFVTKAPSQNMKAIQSYLAIPSI